MIADKTKRPDIVDLFSSGDGGIGEIFLAGWWGERACDLDGDGERDRLTLPRMTALCSHDIVDVGSRSDACARWPYIHLFYSSATWALAQNQVARYPVVAQNRVCCSSLPRYFSFWRERILLFPRLRGGDGGGEPSAAAVRLRRPSDGACFGRQQHVCRSAFYLFTCIDFCVLSLHVRLHPL